ncbi:MAG: AAA family ATPase [bacterium]|nr:AAA family ATPase [bacterium]
MIFRKLILTGFGRFKDYSLELRDGLNIILGPNEAGKTTIIEGISAALFGYRKQFKRDQELWVKYRPLLKGVPYRISVILTTRGGITYRIDRNLEDNRGPNLYQQEEQENYHLMEGVTENNVRELVKEELGLTDISLLEFTLLVRQGELVASQTEGISQAIFQRAIGEQEVGRAFKTLNDSLQEIVKDGYVHKGLLKTYEAKVEELSGRLIEIKKNYSIYESMVKKEAELQSKMSNLKEKIAAIEPLVDGWYTQRDLKEKKDRCDEEVRRIGEVLDKVAECDKELAPLNQTIRSVDLTLFGQETLGKLNAYQGKLSVLRERRAEYDLKMERSKRGRGLFISLLLILSLSLVLQNVLASLMPILKWLLYLIAAFSLGGLVVCLNRFLKIRSISDMLKEIDEEAREAGQEMEDILKGTGCFSLLEYEDTFRKVDTIRNRKKSLEEKREILLGGKPHADWEKQKKDFLASAAKFELALHEIGVILSLAEFTEYEARVIGLKKELDRVKEEDIALKQDLANYDQFVLKGDPGTVESELEESRLKYQGYKFRKEALKLAIKILEEAAEETYDEFAPALRDSTLENFQRLTRGRYKDLTIDKDLQIMVNLPIGEEEGREIPVPVNYLSYGALDQLYLSFRLAVTQYLCQVPQLPFLFDDPFVNFDEERKKVALATLSDLAKDHQIIYFTKDAVDPSVGGRVVELGSG